MSDKRQTEIFEKAFFDDSRIKVSPEDHFKTYTNEFTTNQTNTVIVTPSTGKTLIPHNLGLSTEANSGKVTIAWGTSGKIIGVLYAAALSTASFFGISNHNGTPNETIVVTSTTGANDLFVGIDYSEV